MSQAPQNPRFRHITQSSLRLLALCLTFLSAQLLHGQTGSGPAPFVPVSGSSIDSVNLETGGLQVAIPLWSIKQRGNLSLSFTLRYQSAGVQIERFCSQVSATGTCLAYENHPLAFNCGGNYVACGGMAVTDNISVTLKEIDDVVTSYAVDSSGVTTVEGYYWQLTTPDGSTHKLASMGSGTFRATDGTGWLYNEDSFVLMSQDGLRYVFTCGQSPCVANTVPDESPYPVVGLSYVEDTNGNQIRIVKGGYIDTFGRAISPASGPAANISACPDAPNAPTSATTWTVPGYDGNVTFTFCYADVAIATNFFTENPQYQAIGGYKEISSSLSLLQSVILPDGSAWAFDYNNPNSTTVNFGDLTKITLPTGGTISYVWNPTHARPQLCSIDNNPSSGPLAYPLNFNNQIASRTLRSGQAGATGIWTYSLGTEAVASGFNTTVTDPTNAYVVHTITGLGNSCSYYDTQEQAFSSDGTLLKTETHGYIYQTDFDVPANIAWPKGAPPYMMNVLPTSNTVQWANGATKQTTYAYNNTFTATGITIANPVTATIPYGMPSTETHYDYGVNSPGAALSQRSNTYYGFTNSEALANNLIALPSSVTDTDMVTNQTETTNYGYDESALESGTATPNSSSSNNGWNSTPLAGSVRGNQTSVSRYWDTTSSYLKTTKVFYNTGMLYSVAEPPNSEVSGSLTTSYVYSSAYDGAYLTTLTDPEGNESTFIYDAISGLLTGSTDPNQVSSAYSYYPYMKLESSDREGGDHNLASSVGYSYPTPNSVTKTTLVNSTASESDTTTYDGLGRVTQTEHDDPEGDEYVDTTYDPVGRVYTVSTPYRSSTSTEFYGLTTHLYDGLSRVSQVTNPDSTSVGYSYTGATTQFTNESNGTTASVRLTRVDGLGRLINACEIVTSKTPAQQGGDTASTCGLEISGTGFLTTYTQTLRGMTKSVQGAQTRKFVYDSLSRLTDSTNPETGHIHFVYDADGNLYTQTAPAPNSAQGSSNTLTTTFTYNNVHQVLSKTFSGTGASSTPSATYNYGETTVDGKTLEHPVRRLTSEYTTLGGVVQAKSIYSYDTDGRVASHYQCVLSNCASAYQDVEYQYDGAGNVASFSTPQAGYANTIDSAGHLTQVTPSWTPDPNHPATLMTATYAPNGGLLSANLGNGTTENYTYTPRWLSGMAVANSAGSVYSYSLVRAGDSQVTQAADSVNGTWNYTFDDFNRLITAQQVNGSNAVLNGLSWDYDRYGNRWHQNNTAGSVTSDTMTFNTGTNQAPSNLLYDAAGNVLNDGSHAYAYDAENRIATVDGGVSFIYDAEGRRVGKTDGSSAVAAAATASSGLIMVTGTEMRHYFAGPGGKYAGGCLVFDSGTMTATITNRAASPAVGYTASVNWGRGDSASTIAAKLTGAINAAAGSAVTASIDPLNAANVKLASDASGAATDYDVSVSVASSEAAVFPFFAANPSFDVQATDMSGGEAQVSGAGSPAGTVYVVGLSGAVLDEFDHGDWVRSEIYAGARHIATANASAVVFIHADWLGTERARTSMAGALCQATASQPFGDGAATTGSCAVGTPDFLTGKPRDAESNLDDFGARYLSSQWGRWMSPDWSAAPSGVPNAAFANPQSMNLYAYVGNDPIDGEDPDGHVASLAASLSNLMSAAGQGLDDGLTAQEEYDLLAAQAGSVNASSDTTDSSSASGTGEAQAANQQSQTTPASDPAQATSASTPAQQQNAGASPSSGGTSRTVTLNIGGQKVTVAYSYGNIFSNYVGGVDITATPQNCSGCAWAQVYSRGSGANKDGDGIGPLYGDEGRGLSVFYDTPASSTPGSFTATTILGTTDISGKSFTAIGGFTYGYSINANGGVTMMAPSVATPRQMSGAIQVLQSNSPDWTIH